MVDVTDTRRLEHADNQMRMISQIMDALVEVRPLAERLGARTLKTLIDMALIDLGKWLDDHDSSPRDPRR
ncbi:hypothetical protein MPAR168_00250 [Methylorubrum populi]|uniref:Uncharacterized protein n=2 Tax=Hyphomicrobiales TaxID=356 RepID=A0ABU7T409_9HYPH